MNAAMITSFNWSSRRGLNTLLNSLDYHRNLIDVHILSDRDVPSEYKDRAQTAFDFDVHFHVCNSSAYCLSCSRYALASKLAPKYDAVMVLDCNYMITSSMKRYFTGVCEKPIVMLPCGYRSDDAYIDSSGFSVDSSLLLCSPKYNLELFDSLLSSCDGGNLSSVLTELLVCQGRVRDVLILERTFWVVPPLAKYGIHYRKPVNQEDRRTLFVLNNKVMMVHGCWYKPKEALEALDISISPDVEKLVSVNVGVLESECNQVNEWKLTLDEDP